MSRVLAVVLAAVAIVMVFGQAGVREIEARIAAPVVAMMLGSFPVGSRVFAWENDVIFPTSRDYAAVSISSTCTCAIIVVPMLLVTAVMLAIGRARALRGLLGLAAGVWMVVAINALRLGGIAFAIAHWGMDPGYEISHKVVGSVFAVVGFTAGSLLMIRVAVTDRPAAS